MVSLPIHDPVLIFAIVMSSVLVAPLFAQKLKLPGIVGLIAAGLIVGPHTFGILENDRTIDLLGTIGLLYIMFEAGLEINLGEVKKNKHHSILFGLLTFSVPLVMGILSGVYILKMNLMASVLMASLFSSHTLISFPIVSKLGLSKKSSVSTTIGATIITDTLAFLVMIVVIASNQGNLGVYFWIKLFSLSTLYVALTGLYLPRLTRWFFRNYSSESGVEEYVFVIAVLFILAHLSHMIGLEPVIGAFLAGLVLNTLIPEKSTLMNRVQFIGSSMFIPFFLISVGMIIDVSHFFTGTGALKISLTMITVAILSKYLAAVGFGNKVKLKKSETNLMFAMSVNQAAATLAVVMIGYRVGIFNEDILTGSIMMIVSTCFLGTIFTEKYAKEVMLDEQTNYKVSSDVKTDRILIPVSEANNLKDLIEFAFLIKKKGSHEPLYPLTVAIDGQDVERQILEGERFLAKVVTHANSLQKSVIPLNRIDINVSNAITKVIKEYRISKVIINWNNIKKSHNRVFSKVIDQSVKKSNVSIYITRIIHPVGITENMFLIVPPLINRQIGFVDEFYSIIKMALSINSKLVIISDEPTKGELQKIILKNTSNLNYEFKTLNSWKVIEENLSGIIKDSDMIIQIMAKQGQLAWRLTFDRLPNKLVEKFVNNNLIAVYPSTNCNGEEECSYENTKGDISIIRRLSKNNFLFDFSENNPEKLLKIITDKFSDERESREVYEDLKDVLKKYPVELTHETLLIHTYMESIDDYQVYIATNKNKFSVENVKSNPKVIIVLLSPKSDPMNRHLKVLSEIAKIVTDKKMLSDILGSCSYSEFLERINQR
ncbi:cation:proton antiporter [Ilyobacter polytropus]|uniref:Sodium/hydrogen exchanger n=1 Tax=Ilyobacter polytropus (strain ATCC 51220 / DSM 2926 / LMG 16218 / CuHBu1) TaxID=572544 RepID=E3HBH2_ILYPC|nr:cation:proton antiporter [Ilyobacter polytropus]ADO83787.1 sodium/hydrogen exchanger [Ilyobacter polytropus DSM 2926]